MRKFQLLLLCLIQYLCIQQSMIKILSIYRPYLRLFCTHILKPNSILLKYGQVKFNIVQYISHIENLLKKIIVKSYHAKIH